MLRVIGCDPGRTGALAFLCGGAVLDVIDVPLIPDNSQVQVDGKRLCAWIEKHLPIHLAVIENVQPMRGKGNDSQGMPAGNAFRFGFIAGELRMAFKCYGIDIELVTPGQWKRYFELIKQEKEASRQKAVQLRQEATPWLMRKGDHNRAEAVLIGLFGMEQRGML